MKSRAKNINKLNNPVSILLIALCLFAVSVHAQTTDRPKPATAFIRQVNEAVQYMSNINFLVTGFGISWRRSLRRNTCAAYHGSAIKNHITNKIL